MSKLFFTTNDLPKDTPDGTSEFWRVAHSDEFKSICLITLMQMIPDKNPASLSNEECRSILSSIYTAKIMLQQPVYFKAIERKKAEDEVPEPLDPLHRDDPAPVAPFRQD